MAVTDAVGRGAMIDRADLVEGQDNELTDLNLGLDDQDAAAYTEEALRDWDEELLDSLDKVVEAFSSKANLDEALDNGIFGADAILSSYKVAAPAEESALMTGDVFDVVPSEVNAVFDYTEYTRFGLWTSETIAPATTEDGPDVDEEQQDAADAATGRDMGRYAYSPLGNTDLGERGFTERCKWLL